MRNRRKLIAIFSTAVVGGALLGLIAPAWAEHVPPRPPWIRADGTIDESQFPADGIPAYDLDGNLVCHINLTTYLNAGGVIGVDAVTDSDTPADEFESDVSSSHTDLDEKYLDNQEAIELPGSTLC
jgi:hypothetical protein